MTSFSAFPPATRKFLEGIAANNSKEWFEANRALYEEGYIAPARAFVEAVGPALRTLSPEARFEPKVNGSIGRVNRDTRFSKDKRLYKDNLDLFFWHGDKKGWDHPGFFIRLTTKDVWLGAGMHHFMDEGLTRFRDAVIDDRSGRALIAAIETVEKAGDYVVGSMPRKTVPRGYDKNHPRAKFLLWEGLPAMAQTTMADAMKPGFTDRALAHFRNTWPIGKWLMEYVVD
jgi:uncharacterized protein (TIGR02453 family)